MFESGTVYVALAVAFDQTLTRRWRFKENLYDIFSRPHICIPGTADSINGCPHFYWEGT